jgi:predicted DNA-binding antitoxin AbrB/MazE fold protein
MWPRQAELGCRRKRRIKVVMTKRVEAVYENGLLRPLEPLELSEKQLVSVLISDSEGDPLAPLVDQTFVDSARAEVAAGWAPTHEEVRRITARDTSSWAETIVKGREERL